MKSVFLIALLISASVKAAPHGELSVGSTEGNTQINHAIVGVKGLASSMNLEISGDFAKSAALDEASVSTVVYGGDLKVGRQQNNYAVVSESKMKTAWITPTVLAGKDISATYNHVIGSVNASLQVKDNTQSLLLEKSLCKDVDLVLNASHSPHADVHVVSIFVKYGSAVIGAESTNTIPDSADQSNTQTVSLSSPVEGKVGIFLQHTEGAGSTTSIGPTFALAKRVKASLLVIGGDKAALNLNAAF